MEDHCSPLGRAYFHQGEGIEELRHYLLYKRELETTIFSAQEEITRRELEVLHLKDLLSRTIKERNEAQQQCKRLFLDKLILEQQLLQKQEQHQHQPLQQPQEEMAFPKQEDAPLFWTSSSEDESKFGDSSDHVCSPDSKKTIVSSQLSDPISLKSLQSPIPEAILKLAAAKPLPEKGKLLKAVKEAGPLLQHLLLAGPLPQWQHPPPQLNSVDIPPVTISPPTARLIHKDSFNGYLGRERGPGLSEGPDSCSSPNSKCQRVFPY